MTTDVKIESYANCSEHLLAYLGLLDLYLLSTVQEMRQALESCGCTIPVRVARASGVLGEFPGINVEPGPELAIDQWRRFGITSGR